MNGFAWISAAGSSLRSASEIVTCGRSQVSPGADVGGVSPSSPGADVRVGVSPSSPGADVGLGVSPLAISPGADVRVGEPISHSRCGGTL